VAVGRGVPDAVGTGSAAGWGKAIKAGPAGSAGFAGLCAMRPSSVLPVPAPACAAPGAVPLGRTDPAGTDCPAGTAAAPGGAACCSPASPADAWATSALPRRAVASGAATGMTADGVAADGIVTDGIVTDRAVMAGTAVGRASAARMAADGVAPDGTVTPIGLLTGAVRSGVGWPVGAPGTAAAGSGRAGPTGVIPPAASPDAVDAGSGPPAASMAGTCCGMAAIGRGSAYGGSAASSPGAAATVLSFGWLLGASPDAALAFPSIDGTVAAGVRSGAGTDAGGMVPGPGAPARLGASARPGSSGAGCCVPAWLPGAPDSFRKAAKPVAAPGCAAATDGRPSAARSGAGLSGVAEAA